VKCPTCGATSRQPRLVWLRGGRPAFHNRDGMRPFRALWAEVFHRPRSGPFMGRTWARCPDLFHAPARFRDYPIHSRDNVHPGDPAQPPRSHYPELRRQKAVLHKQLQGKDKR